VQNAIIHLRDYLKHVILVGNIYKLNYYLGEITLYLYLNYLYVNGADHNGRAV
jgi:hypothetical protein